MTNYNSNTYYVGWIRRTLVNDNSLTPTATWVLEVADVNMCKAKLVFFCLYGYFSVEVWITSSNDPDKMLEPGYEQLLCERAYFTSGSKFLFIDWFIYILKLFLFCFLK